MIFGASLWKLGGGLFFTLQMNQSPSRFLKHSPKIHLQAEDPIPLSTFISLQIVFTWQEENEIAQEETYGPFRLIVINGRWRMVEALPGIEWLVGSKTFSLREAGILPF